MFERLKRIFTAGNAGKEAEMDDAKKEGATPPAQSGGLDEAKISALIAATIATALKPVTESVSQLAGQVTELGKAKAAPEPKPVDKKEEAKALTAEEIAKLVNDGITGALAKREEGAAAAAKKAEARKKVMAAKGLDKLPASLINLPDTDDEAKLAAAADQLVTDLNASGVKLGDVGGASKDGGKPAGQGGDDKAPAGVGGLTPALAKYAAEIKLPA